MCWVSDALAPDPPNFEDPEHFTGCNMATRFHPPSPDDLLAELARLPGASQPLFSQPEESTKAVPEGSGKRIRTVRTGANPAKPRRSVLPKRYRLMLSQLTQRTRTHHR